MHARFVSPPNDLRPLQIVHGMEGLRQAGGGDLGVGLDRLVALGIGGVVANVNFGPGYLRDEQAWQTFLEGFRLARARGMEFWIYDEEGYPSGAAGTLVLEGNPEYEACGLTCHQAPVAPGEQGTIDLPERSRSWVYACALPLAGERPQLSGAEAVAVPRGREPVTWTNGHPERRLLVAFADRVMYEDTHCTTNVFAKRRYVNLLDPKVGEKFIRVTHDAYAGRLGERIKQVRAFFTDEPSLMTAYLAPLENPRPPALPWQADLPAFFAKEAGYDLLPRLPALFLQMGRESRRVRSDFYRVVTERLVAAFYGPIRERTRALGTAASGHVLCEERLSWHAWFEGDLFQVIRQFDLPGIDILTSNPAELLAGDGFLTPKFVSSAAHLIGAERVMSETSDFVQRMAKSRATVEQMMAATGVQYALGVNLITSYYPWWDYEGRHEVGWLPAAEGANGYRTYCNFTARLGAAMVGGSHRCDVALYYPIEAVHAYFGLTDQPYWKGGIHGPVVQRTEDALRDLARDLLVHQRDFDVLDRQAVLEGKAGRGALQVGDERYRVLVFAAARVLPPAVLEAALRLQQAGGQVVFAVDLPREAPNPEEDHRVTDLVSRLLAAGARVVPEGFDLAAALEGVVPPTVALEPGTRGILACRRENEGRQVCLLVNYTDQPLTFTAVIPGWKAAELWWPDNGEIARVPDLAAHVITLAGYRSVLVVRP